MDKIARFIKESRKAAGLTQEEFALRSGLGLRFVRELEQSAWTRSTPRWRCLAWKPYQAERRVSHELFPDRVCVRE